MIDIEVRTPVIDSYRANRIGGLFNVLPEHAASHRVRVDAPIDERPWRIGLVVGPSGSGKTTLGRALLGDGGLFQGHAWAGLPIIDEIGPGEPIDDVTAALSAVGLGSVPSWLRPYGVLSGGERFRADLARLLVGEPRDVVFDEFTSVVDRQVATIAAAAFSKAWRRKPAGRFVALSCHYDVLEWLQPDWVIDTADWSFTWRSVQRPPTITADILETNWALWPRFEPHHYLKIPKMIAATNYVAWVGDHPVAHLAVSTVSGLVAARACRLVVMPEWQGAGVGMRFLNRVCQHWLDGENRYNKRLTTLFHTSHPGLIAALIRDPKWVRTSQQVCGINKVKDRKTGNGASNGYGGHTRAINGFRYVGAR